LRGLRTSGLRIEKVRNEMDKEYITLFKLLIAEMVCIPITDIINNEIICIVIKKRLAYYKLPPFSEYAILAIFFLSKGNVGHAILILTDILEKYDTLKPEKITASFIFEFVYPKGLSKEQLQVLYNININIVFFFNQNQRFLFYIKNKINFRCKKVGL